MRKVLSASGSTSKSFMMLELGLILVQFVIMKKRLQFLHHILTESTEALVRQVFDVLKEDSRKGYFVNLTNIDCEEFDIDLNNEEIADISKYSRKKYLKEKTDTEAFNLMSQRTEQRK